MALCRVLNNSILRLLSAKNSLKRCELLTITNPFNVLSQERGFRKGWGRTLRAMKLRRKIAGPDRIRKRNEWDNWNYKAELYSFSKRLHENITETTLRRAFIHDSYIESEEQKRRELDIPIHDVSLDLQSNSPLIDSGKKIASDFLKKYLCHCFQHLPEEGIAAVHNYLMSDKVLAHISYNIGTKDLILCSEYPLSKNTLANSLLAIVGSIASDDSITRAEKFVLDFICMQLIGKDILEIWDIQNPSDVLNSILRKHGMSEYEPRLIFESGRNTIEAIYHVGLYSDKQFLSRGAGETLDIAEELAAYDCLRKLFQIRECEQPFSTKIINQEELPKIINENPTLEDWHVDSVHNLKIV